MYSSFLHEAAMVVFRGQPLSHSPDAGGHRMTAAVIPLPARGWGRVLLILMAAAVTTGPPKTAAQSTEGSGDGGGETTTAMSDLVTMVDKTTTVAILTDMLTPMTTAMDLSATTIDLMVDSSTVLTTTTNTTGTNSSLAMELYLEYAEVDYSLLLPILPNATQVHLGLLVDERYRREEHTVTEGGGGGGDYGKIIKGYREMAGTRIHML